jgi:quercetin dioxygenase-like cupin family protein
MRYAFHADDRPDGRLHANELLTQRVVELSGGEHVEAADEVIYVLGGDGELEVGGQRHRLRPGTAAFIAEGTRWTAAGVRVLSVLVHDPPPASAAFGVRDLTEEERGSATSGRQFVLGARPELGCVSATQFIGLVPPGRAPDHYHTYDEVIYILEGEGELHIGGESASLRPGTCVHLPARLVHCLANTGDSELRLLGVFRPAGSPAEAYYPDGTPAAGPDAEEVDS